MSPVTGKIKRSTTPRVPIECSYEEAIDDPMRLPLEHRHVAALEALAAGDLTGWEALAFTVWGIATLDEDDT